MAYTYHELKEKTVQDLREIAKTVEKHDAVQGYSQMNKDHLLPATSAASPRSVTKLRLKPPSDDKRSARESSLLGGRCAAAKTASKASSTKTCFIPTEHGFRRCLVALRISFPAVSS